MKKDLLKNNPAIGMSWEEFEKEYFTPEEIAASDLRVAIIGELIKARREKGLTQKELENITGIKQPVINVLVVDAQGEPIIGANVIEKGTTNPQIATILKLLAPLGKTLAVVPLKPVNSTT